MKASTIVILLCIYFLLPAQKNTSKVVNDYDIVDKQMLLINDSLTTSTDGISAYIIANFKTDTEKARSVYFWVTQNIEYDVQNMYAMNFYEKREEKVSKALSTRKGICEHFAALFQEICTKVGIKSFVIEGYTKQNGMTDYIPHAWAAAFIDSNWYLFDPTWGSGHIKDHKFFKKTNNTYFMVPPDVMIRSHMPFDFMWQFLKYPVTNQEFYEGKIFKDTTKPYFDYNDTLEWYLAMPQIDQMESAARRVESNGLKNSMVFDRLRHLRQTAEIYRRNQSIESYNTASKYHNEAINDLNNFIRYRNNQFDPVKSDPEIQSMLDKPKARLKDAKNMLAEIQQSYEQLDAMIRQLKTSINDLETQLNQQQRFLSEYLSKGRAGRRSMFYKTTFFGIPID